MFWGWLALVKCKENAAKTGVCLLWSQGEEMEEERGRLGEEVQRPHLSRETLNFINFI